MVLVTMASMAGSYVGITHTTLMGSVIPIDIRGRYITTRQKVCMVISLTAGLCYAFLLDTIPGYLGYTIVFTFGGICGLIDILMYTKVDFSSIPHKKDSSSLMKSIKACFANKTMRNYLFFWTTWNFSIHLSGPFFNKYAIDVLSLSYVSIIIFGQIAAQAMAFLIISRWGRFIDKYGSVPMLVISTIGSSLVGLVWLVAVPGSIWPLFIFNIIGGMFWCANDAGNVNMQLSHTPVENRTPALALFAVFTSLSAATALILGGALLEGLSPIMARADLTFLGTPFDHYKLVFCISIVVRLVVVSIFLPRVWNEKGLRIKEAYSKLINNTKDRIKYERSRLKLSFRKKRK